MECTLRDGGYSMFASWAGLAAYKPDVLGLLRNSRILVFDLDGTILDVRGSYTEATLSTARYLSAKIVGYSNIPTRDAMLDAILTLKETGNYNNDWDTTYALTLASVISTDEDISFDESITQLASLGLEDVYSMRHNFTSLDEIVRYPGSPPSSMLQSIFDSIYYGDDLYRSIYSVEPPLRFHPGLIYEEEIAVSEQTLKFLGSLMDHLGVISGRPERALIGPSRRLLEGGFKREFVFMGSTKRPWKMGSKLLLTISERTEADRIVYIGDSAEDLMLSRAAEDGVDIVFIGIYGLSLRPLRTACWLASENADVILPSADLLPLILS